MLLKVLLIVIIINKLTIHSHSNSSQKDYIISNDIQQIFLVKNQLFLTP